MAQGHLTQLVQRAKQLLVSDPQWWKSFKTKSNSLADVISQGGGSRPGPLNSQDLYESAATLARLELVSRWTGPTKTTNVVVTPEGAQVANVRTFDRTTRRIIQEFINETDWVRQRGSDSPVEAVHKDLRKVIKAAGGKVSGPTEAVRRSGKASATIRRGELVHRLTGKNQGELDLSIMALLNAKLPPAVRENMQGDALHNRTGRFSESVRIVGVEQTPQGFPRLLYTYQRAPYDVFDPVIGALPWATPGRDPKTLINKSIRDVARELAIGRFYTRRT